VRVPVEEVSRIRAAAANCTIHGITGAEIVALCDTITELRIDVDRAVAHGRYQAKIDGLAPISIAGGDTE
jgi:hypothetical protein